MALVVAAEKKRLLKSRRSSIGSRRLNSKTTNDPVEKRISAKRITLPPRNHSPALAPPKRRKREANPAVNVKAPATSKGWPEGLDSSCGITTRVIAAASSPTGTFTRNTHRHPTV